jgi:hypothetical protein
MTSIPEKLEKKRKLKLINIGLAPHDGIITIGISPHGLISIGAIPHGVISIGLVPMGVFSLGFVSMGLVSIGNVSMGLLSIGKTTMSIVQPQQELLRSPEPKIDSESGDRHKHHSH